jgi:hypothetical protein
LFESSIGTDDVLPIVALPNGSSEPFGYCGLEGADYYGDGSGMPDPYIKDENAMDMIRHDYKRIQGNVREMVRDFIPAGGNNIGNVVEDTAPIPGANGYEVCAWCGVVKTW